MKSYACVYAFVCVEKKLLCKFFMFVLTFNLSHLVEHTLFLIQLC